MGPDPVAAIVRAPAVAAYPLAANRSRIFGAAVGALTVLVVFFMVWKPKLW